MARLSSSRDSFAGKELGDGRAVLAVDRKTGAHPEPQEELPCEPSARRKTIMTMNTRHASLWIAACAAWVGVGCSTRALHVGDVTIETQPPIELTHEGFAFPSARRPLLRRVSRKVKRRVHRAGARLRHKIAQALDPSAPRWAVSCVFDKSGANLMTVSSGTKHEMVAYSLADGTPQVIASGMDPTYFGGTVSYNADQTIVTTGGKVRPTF